MITLRSTWRWGQVAVHRAPRSCLPRPSRPASRADTRRSGEQHRRRAVDRVLAPALARSPGAASRRTTWRHRCGGARAAPGGVPGPRELGDVDHLGCQRRSVAPNIACVDGVPSSGGAQGRRCRTRGGVVSRDIATSRNRRTSGTSAASGARPPGVGVAMAESMLRLQGSRPVPCASVPAGRRAPSSSGLSACRRSSRSTGSTGGALDGWGLGHRLHPSWGRAATVRQQGQARTGSADTAAGFTDVGLRRRPRSAAPAAAHPWPAAQPCGTA